MVVANCNASRDWLHIHCSQWWLLLFFHPDSRWHLSQYGRFHAVSFGTASRDATSPRLVAKREQIVCMTSCEFNELAVKPKFVAQSRPGLYSPACAIDKTDNR